MSWLYAHALQIVCIAAVLILLTLGQKRAIPKIQRAKKPRTKTLAKWVAFGVAVIAGLILTVALTPIVRSLTQLGAVGGIAAVIGNLGAIIALTLGWQSIKQIIVLVRDLADGEPDDEARKAALWLPTFLPAGWAAVWGLLQNPAGLGRGLTAAVMAGITLVYVFSIIKASLAGSSHQQQWKFFAAAVALLGGVVMIPLVAYVDTAVIAGMLPGEMVPWVRILLGVVGVALLAGLALDLSDGEPDEWARQFLIFGVPLLFVFGGLGLDWLAGDGASSGAQILASVIS